MYFLVSKHYSENVLCRDVVDSRVLHTGSIFKDLKTIGDSDWQVIIGFRITNMIIFLRYCLRVPSCLFLRA